MLRVALLGIVLLLGAQASAKSFYDYCVKPDSDAQINTVVRLLRAVGLPGDRTPPLCHAGQQQLSMVESLTFKPIIVHHGFSSTEVEPISDLRPLESLVQLKKLDLEGETLARAFATHNPFAPLVALTELRLANMHFTRMEYLETLPNLETLTLNQTEVSDFSPLASLPLLKTLDVSSNPVRDLAVLEQLPRLKHFTFESHNTNHMLPNADFVKPLSQLVTLRLPGHNIKYLTALEGLKTLRVLDLHSNRVMDVEPISQLPRLEALDLGSNNIHDISLLARLTTLKKLVLNSNHVTKANALESLVNLQTLDMSGNVVGLLTLHHHNKLESLRAISCGLFSLYGIPENDVLKHLDVSHNKLTSLDRMAFMKGLESASLYENQISEIGQLASHETKKLRFLSLSRNKVAGVEALKGFINLEQLVIQDNLVKDFAPLEPLVAPHLNSQGKTITLWLQK